MKLIFLSVICTLFTLSGTAQSLCGNVNSAESHVAIQYGNVDIFKEGKLVASVLTDREGNFNVPLDTGRYTCVVSYSGFHQVTKELTVKKDEKAEFNVTADKSKKQPRAFTEASAPVTNTVTHELREIGDTDGTIRRDRVSGGIEGDVKSLGSKEVIAYDEIFGPPKTQQTKAKSGALTAGEINDFSKWKMWQDIVATDLATYQTAWNIAPKGRYTLMLQSESGIPLADAVVSLIDGKKTTLFTSRTDNTGKAELWLTIKNETPTVNGKLSILVNYHGQSKLIERVTAFEESMNHLKLNVTCEQTENVDIAFVVDATGSMGDELNYLKAEMNDIVYQSKQIDAKLNFRFANVFYRDKGANELYLTRKMDFNRVLSESVSYIDEQYAGGGGDYEEAVETALDVAINELQWSETARTRVLFLILDAPPHNTPETQAKLQTLMNQAAEKGIRIVPIGASGINKSTEYLMRSLALGTNGTYTFLTNHSGIGSYHIEPTTDKFDAETLNGLLVRIMKSYTYMPDCDQQIPDLVLNYPDSIVQYPLPVDTVTPNDTIDTNGRVVVHDPPVDSVHVTWSYYPNPTNGIVNIVSDTDIEELYITDLTGKLLQVLPKIEAGRTVQVDLSQYATGIYLIRYPVGKHWISGKVVLQRNS